MAKAKAVMLASAILKITESARSRKQNTVIGCLESQYVLIREKVGSLSTFFLVFLIRSRHVSHPFFRKCACFMIRSVPIRIIFLKVEIPLKTI